MRTSPFRFKYYEISYSGEIKVSFFFHWYSCNFEYINGVQQCISGVCCSRVESVSLSWSGAAAILQYTTKLGELHAAQPFIPTVANWEVFNSWPKDHPTVLDLMYYILIREIENPPQPQLNLHPSITTNNTPGGEKDHQPLERSPCRKPPTSWRSRKNQLCLDPYLTDHLPAREHAEDLPTFHIALVSCSLPPAQ